MPLSHRGEAALAWARRGLCVFPGAPGSKRPIVAGGFHAATRDAELIAQWWTQWPDANPIVATGKVSSVVVVDVDPRNGGDATLAKLIATNGPLPKTVEVLTGGGGRHLYFAYPEHAPARWQITLGDGLDVLADGKQATLPPSIHESGKVYRFAPGCSFEECPVAVAPLWLSLIWSRPAEPPKPARAPDSELDRAVERFNREHTPEWPSAIGPCPCHPENGEACFHRHPQTPLRWICFSTFHPSDCGLRSNTNGIHGDALDIEAWKAGRRGMRGRIEHLRAMGYLEQLRPAAPARPQPRPVTTSTLHPKRAEAIRDAVELVQPEGTDFEWIGMIAAKRGVANVVRAEVCGDAADALERFDQGVQRQDAKLPRPRRATEATARRLRRAIESASSQVKEPEPCLTAIEGVEILEVRRQLADGTNSGPVDLVLRVFGDEVRLSNLDGPTICTWAKIMGVAASHGIFMPNGKGYSSAWTWMLVAAKARVVIDRIPDDMTVDGRIRKEIRSFIASKNRADEFDEIREGKVLEEFDAFDQTTGFIALPSRLLAFVRENLPEDNVRGEHLSPAVRQLGGRIERPRRESGWRPRVFKFPPTVLKDSDDDQPRRDLELSADLGFEEGSIPE